MCVSDVVMGLHVVRVFLVCNHGTDGVGSKYLVCNIGNAAALGHFSCPSPIDLISRTYLIT